MAILEIGPYLGNRCPSSTSTLWGRKRVYLYLCNFWNFGQWPSFMPKYGNFENGPVSRKPLPVERKLSFISTTLNRKRVYVKLLEHLPMAKFHAEIFQFLKSCINEPKFCAGTFDLLVFKVSLESFGALVSKWHETRK